MKATLKTIYTITLGVNGEYSFTGSDKERGF